MAVQGMHLITPSSVTTTGVGSSATTSANGSVVFTTCTGVYLNGVFSLNYDNYIMVCRGNESTASYYRMRMCKNGTPNAVTNAYFAQLLYSNATSVTSALEVSDNAILNIGQGVLRSGFIANIYGPFLAQPTEIRSITVDDGSSGIIYDSAISHNDFYESYDGIALLRGSGTMTGRVAIYGMRL